MRFFLCVLLAFAFIAAYLVEDPARVSNSMQFVQERIARIWRSRAYEISGNTLLTDEQILKLLPEDHGNLWWRFNLPVVQSKLLESPIIERSDVTPCGAFYLNCYRIKVTERKPAFVAVVEDGSKAWVIARDGSFLVPLTNKQYKEGALTVFGPDSKKLVLVKGLWSERSSPDEVRARLQRIDEALNRLLAGTRMNVDELALVRNSEIEVLFGGVPFPVTFDLEHTDDDTLLDKGERLRKLLAEMDGNFSKVEKVDFAFNGLAVVKLVETRRKS